MMTFRKKKRIRKIVRFGIILIIGTIAFRKAKPMITDYVTDKAITKVVSHSMSQFGIDESVVNDVIDSISNEDINAVKDMVTNYYNDGAIEKAVDAYQKGGVESLKEFVDDNIKSEDKEKLQDMYDKYIKENIEEIKNGDIQISTDVIEDAIEELKDSDLNILIEELEKLPEGDINKILPLPKGD